MSTMRSYITRSGGSMPKQFAPDYARDENGLVLFPVDTPLRRQLFPYTDPSEHIAKANMYMVRELVEFVSEPGETILDPFAGTGTILVAATMGRFVTMIELIDTFCQTIELNTIGVRQTIDFVDDLVTLIPGDAASILPIENFCNHMIFSPPYPQGLKKKGSMDKTSKDLGYDHATDYSEGDQRNFTNLNDFLYHQKIEQFYKKCLQSVKPRGTMTVIIKDRMEKGQRVMQADRTERDCLRMGWELAARNKWLARGGGYAAINRAAGLETVDDEDLITLRRPK
jgi:16S rRNA G966 N2-methylase RsmD